MLGLSGMFGPSDDWSVSAAGFVRQINSLLEEFAEC